MQGGRGPGQVARQEGGISERARSQRRLLQRPRPTPPH